MASTSLSYNSTESEEEFSDDGSESPYDETFGGKTGIIFLIDARKNMVDGIVQVETDFFRSLQCCEKILRSESMSKDPKHVGIILFGTRTDSSSELKNVKTIVPLNKASMDSMKMLRTIIYVSLETYKENVGYSEEYSLGNALWFCTSFFTKSIVKFRKRIVFLLTNDCNPHKDDPIEQQLVRTKAKDLIDIGIELQLPYMGKDFDVSVFYKEILEMNEKPTILPHPFEDFDDIVEEVMRCTARVKPVGNLILIFEHTIKIGVSCYNLYRKAKIPTSEKLCRLTNEPLKSVMQNSHSETGALLLPTDMVHTMQSGDETITFTPEEKKTLNYMTAPGVTILGFKPASAIKIEEQFKPASFLYPNEELLEGSEIMFVCLLNTCLQYDRVLLCSISTSHSKHPHTAILKPQKEHKDETGNKSRPGGFHVIYMPFKDSIRPIPEEAGEKIPEVTEHQVGKAKSVIKKLSFKYVPAVFNNPRLATHWANIEALALEENEPRVVVDNTVPDQDYMEKRLGTLSDEFKKSVYPDNYNPESTATGKRSASPSAGPSMNKFARFGKSAKVEKLICEKKVHTLKVIELKEYMATEFPNVPLKGFKKQDLVDLIYELADD